MYIIRDRSGKLATVKPDSPELQNSILALRAMLLQSMAEPAEMMDVSALQEILLEVIAND